MSVIYGFFALSGLLFWALIVIGALRRPRKTEQPVPPPAPSVVAEAERILRGEP